MGSSRQIEWFRYHFPEVVSVPVLDVGCGDASSLAFFGAGSVGLDGDERYLSSGSDHSVLKWTFDDDIRTTLEKHGQNRSFKYVCCLNTMEHVIAPHLQLLNLRRCMEDGGYLYLSIPLSRVRLHAAVRMCLPRKLHRYWQGYLQSDHVNFWIPSTFDLTVEYAGYEIISRYYGGVHKKLSNIGWLNNMLGLISPTYGVVCRKIPDWNYREKNSVWKTLNADGYVEWVDRINTDG